MFETLDIKKNGLNAKKNVRINIKNIDIFGTTLKKYVMIIGDPSYTSTNQ
jgi:hypothetical protein